MKKTLSLVLALAMICAAAAAMAAPVEIDYWSVFTGGDGATMQAMVDEFNASQDEVHVNHTPMTADDLYQKIPLTVQTGTGIPDVTVVHIERIPDFVEKELLYSYDMDLLAEAGIERFELPYGCSLALRGEGEEEYAFLLNFAAEACKVNLSGVDALSGERLETVELEGHGVRVLKQLKRG